MEIIRYVSKAMLGVFLNDGLEIETFLYSYSKKKKDKFHIIPIKIIIPELPEGDK